MDTTNWYKTLLKPSWAPPSNVFGPVWTFLYLIITATYGYVFYKVITKQIPWAVAIPFILNLIFNFAFTPIQFGLKNNTLAFIDILLVLLTLLLAFYKIWPYSKTIVYLNLPYLFWVCFATILQGTITYLNR